MEETRNACNSLCLKTSWKKIAWNSEEMPRYNLWIIGRLIVSIGGRLACLNIVCNDGLCINGVD
jgi:hypothetical protein